MADRINELTHLFNTDLFNRSYTKVKKVIYTAMPQDAPTPGAAPSNQPAKIRRDFASVAEDTIVEVQKPPGVYKRPVIGNFSAVRAARILHQHQVGFWTDLGVVELVAEPLQPDPSPDDTEQMYQDFLLFNYPPLARTPTKTDFVDMVTSSKTAVVLKDRLPQMGIVTGGKVQPRLNDHLTNPSEADSDPTPFLPVQPPFAESLKGNPFSRQPLLSR